MAACHKQGHSEAGGSGLGHFLPWRLLEERLDLLWVPKGWMPSEKGLPAAVSTWAPEKML